MVLWRQPLLVCYIANVLGVRVRNQQLLQDETEVARTDCSMQECMQGYAGITQEECERRGCCFDATKPGGHVCYQRSLSGSEVFHVMKNRTESRSRNACEGMRKIYKIPPLENRPDKGALEKWCKNEWPKQSDERSPPQKLCSQNRWPKNSMNKEMVDVPVQIPMGAVEVEYKISKSLSGGVNNMGVFIMQKSSIEERFASYPDKLVLKLGVPNDFDRENACMQATYGIDGLPKLYSDAFIFKGTCYKGLAIELASGRSWADVMPLDADSECQLQETAGRLMCDIANRGFEEMDWNNPGNWIVSEGDAGLPKFNRIDLGLCYRHFNVFDKEYRDAFWQQRAGPLTTSRWDMMWHMKKSDTWGNRLGVGDLILNSQRRIDVLQGISSERPAPIATVYFPGSYVSQLGGEDWKATDIHCKARRSRSGNRFTLKLLDLKPGLYEFKAVIDPEKTKWTNSVGGGDGENAKFRITADKSMATITYNAWARTISVDVAQLGDISSVSFPGTYVEQLGGKEWDPTDTHCLAHRDLDAVTYYLQVSNLKPGEYFFKAVVDPEKNGWAGNVGARGSAGNIPFRIPWWFKDRAAHESTATLTYNSLTKSADVSFVQPGDVSSVFFPGNFVEQLGGENWAPTDIHCLAHRGLDETTFNLKLNNLKPGEYFFKAVIDPEKKAPEKIWSENIGVGGKDGRNFRLHIATDKSEATIKYNALTRVVAVDVVEHV